MCGGKRTVADAAAGVSVSVYACSGTHPFNCEDGCLFDLDEDWTEHVNLRTTRPTDFKRLQARFAELKGSVQGGHPDSGGTALVAGGDFEWAPPVKAAACAQMWNQGGFWGPLASSSKAIDDR